MTKFAAEKPAFVSSLFIQGFVPIIISFDKAIRANWSTGPSLF
jgi:hypothetical protein